MSKVDTDRTEMRVLEKHEMGVFERYLTLWVAICIIIGLLLGRLFPDLSIFLAEFEVFHVSIPIAVALFFMIYSIMVQIDFRRVVDAAKTPKPVLISSTVNWLIKPFSKTILALLFFGYLFAPFLPAAEAESIIAGLILLGVAPCTAMVLMWVYLSKGNQGLNLVMIAIDSLIMIVVYAPLASFLLGVSGIIAPMDVIAFSIAVYVGLPLIVGYVSRTELIRRKGMPWFKESFTPVMGNLSKAALLMTLIILFTLQGDVILTEPFLIFLIAVPLTVQFFIVFGIGLLAARLGKLTYEDAVPVAMVGTSNHFEVAIAVATMIYGLNSYAALATVVGVLIEVPIMLALVRIMLRIRKRWMEQPS